jgi:hypothetical protein
MTSSLHHFMVLLGLAKGRRTTEKRTRLPVSMFLTHCQHASPCWMPPASLSRIQKTISWEVLLYHHWNSFIVFRRIFSGMKDVFMKFEYHNEVRLSNFTR